MCVRLLCYLLHLREEGEKGEEGRKMRREEKKEAEEKREPNTDQDWELVAQGIHVPRPSWRHPSHR